MTTPKLGQNQRGFLRAMQRHYGFYYAGCGWLWDTPSGSNRLAESLVRRGLAEIEPNATARMRTPYYRLTEAGKNYDAT